METSPYQIRLEVLKMAKDLVQDRFYSERDRIQTNWDNKRNVEGRVDSDLTHPPFPSSQDVLDLAKELYTFVQTKA